MGDAEKFAAGGEEQLHSSAKDQQKASKMDGDGSVVVLTEIRAWKSGEMSIQAQARKVAAAEKSWISRDDLNLSIAANGSGTSSGDNKSAMHLLDQQIELFFDVIHPSNLMKMTTDEHKDIALKLMKRRTLLLNEAQEVQLKMAEMLNNTTEELLNENHLDGFWEIMCSLVQKSKVKKLRVAVVKDFELRRAEIMDKDQSMETPGLQDHLAEEAGLDVNKVPPPEVNTVVVDPVKKSDQEEEAAGVENRREEIKNRKILELEELMTQKLTKTIMELETEENNLDDIENNPFTRSEIYEKKFTECYRRLCDISGASHLTDRPVHKKINITNRSVYPEFEKVVQDYLNTTGFCLDPPDFARVHQLVSSHNETAKLKYDKISIKNIAENLHLVVVKELRVRRLKDTTYVRLAFPLLVNEDDTNVDVHDPADTDPELARKLEENQKNRKSEKDVLKSFLLRLENIVSDDEEENIYPSPPVSDLEYEDNGDSDDELWDPREKVSEAVLVLEDKEGGSSQPSVPDCSVKDTNAKCQATAKESRVVIEPPAKKVKLIEDGISTEVYKE